MYSKDSVALVTGAATGIGLATAEAYARAGCRVVLADKDEDRGQQAARSMSALGVDTLFVAADVADPAQVSTLHERIVSTFGRLDAACNNAGIEGAMGPTAECSLENFDRVIGINLRGLFLCLKAQLAIMSQQDSGGAIVNMASVAGLVGFAGLPAYCASKGGVVQLTRTAALEYAEQNVRVNAVCPGAIKTEMIDRITGEDPATEKQFAALHPMNRMGSVHEVADTVVWLTSAQAGFITGQAVPVDGGMTSR